MSKAKPALAGGVKRVNRPRATLEELSRCLTYDPWTGWFTRKGRLCGVANTAGYIEVYFAGRRYPAHRMAWFFLTGEWPTEVVDHINRRRWDNSAKNLRHVSSLENNKNRGAFGESLKDHGHWMEALKALSEAKIKINNEPSSATYGRAAQRTIRMMVARRGPSKRDLESKRSAAAFQEWRKQRVKNKPEPLA